MLRRLIFILLMLPTMAQAQTEPNNLIKFLKNCGWGMAIGAGVGAVSLVFEDRPSEHTINIARGASLGLYGGILYGFSASQQRPQTVTPSERWGFVPKLEKGKLSGLEVAGVIASF